MKTYAFWLEFHWSFFLDYRRIYASRGLNELIMVKRELLFLQCKRRWWWYGRPYSQPNSKNKARQDIYGFSHTVLYQMIGCQYKTDGRRYIYLFLSENVWPIGVTKESICAPFMNMDKI